MATSVAKRILFVDDDDQILRTIERIVRAERGSWEMTFVVGGRAALEMLRERTFDIVVTDLEMPDVDGIAVLRAARDHAAGATRIVLTGSGVDPSTLDAHAVLQKATMTLSLRQLLANLDAGRSLPGS